MIGRSTGVDGDHIAPCLWTCLRKTGLLSGGLLRLLCLGDGRRGDGDCSLHGEGRGRGRVGGRCRARASVGAGAAEGVARSGIEFRAHSVVGSAGLLRLHDDLYRAIIKQVNSKNRESVVRAHFLLPPDCCCCSYVTHLVLVAVLLDVAAVLRRLAGQQVQASWKHIGRLQPRLATGGGGLGVGEVHRTSQVLRGLEFPRHLVRDADVLDGSGTIYIILCNVCGVQQI
jgi:hypothetical protein